MVRHPNASESATQAEHRQQNKRWATASGNAVVRLAPTAELASDGRGPLLGDVVLGSMTSSGSFC